MSVQERWTGAKAILHADLDCFFAAAEVKRNPSLRGLPVLVGGSGPRGVVAAASYEARIFGVHSALPMSVARRLCPQAVILDGDHSYYRGLSQGFLEILSRITPQVEMVSLDEAFLDVTGSFRLHGGPLEIALKLRDDVARELQLSVCVGVGSTKQVAKLASRRAKPRLEGNRVLEGEGVFVVAPNDEREFLFRTKVGELWGVGPKMVERLKSLGVSTVGDLLDIPSVVVESTLGKAGLRLLALGRGEDSNAVVASAPRKSIGHEQTYPKDLVSRAQIWAEIARLSDSVAMRAYESSLRARTVVLKVRFGDFQTVTRSKTLPLAVGAQAVINRTAREMLPSEVEERGVRLLGVSLSNFSAPALEQLTFDVDQDRVKVDALAAVVAEVKERFGESSVASAALLEGGHVRTRKRGDSLWGPSRD